MSGKGSLHEAVDSTAWPTAVPARILWAIWFIFFTGASGLKYQPLAPESTSAVLMRSRSRAASSLAVNRRARRRSHFRRAAVKTLGGGGKVYTIAARLLGKGGGVGLRVGGVGAVKESSLVLFISLTPHVPAPNRQRHNFQ